MTSSIDLALRAFEERPTRHEALADLARAAREAGRNEVAAMFARRGIAIPPSDDLLFVESWARDAMREDLSISGFYSVDPETRVAAARTCDELGLDRIVSRETRDLARQNLEFYLRPIAEVFPSWQARRLTFNPPDGYNAMAPSVTRHGDHILAAQRTVNYKIDARGYVRVADDLPLTAGAKIHTRTFLTGIDPDTLDCSLRGEILLPADLPVPTYDVVTGFEDTRLFSWRGYLWGLSTVLDQNPDARAEQWLARIGLELRMEDARPIHPEGPIQPREKNWIPLVDGGQLRFIYRSDPTRIIDHDGRTVVESIPDIAADHFSGSSQAIRFIGGWLAIVHWRQWFDGWPKYRHRFAWYDDEYRLKAVSPGWIFSTKQPELGLLAGYEYCTGLCWHPDGDRFIVGYQIHEREAWIGTAHAHDVARSLGLRVDKLVDNLAEDSFTTATALRAYDIEVPVTDLRSTYLKSPSELFASWQSRRLRFPPPHGYAAMVPSVIFHDGRLIASVRCINYAPGAVGGTYYRISDHASMGGDVKPHSRTLFIEVDADTLAETVIGELSMPTDLLPTPRLDAVAGGFEDIRLFSWDGMLWGIAAFAEQSLDGLVEQWLIRLGDDLTIRDARPIFPKKLQRRSEKNWMPMIGSAPPRFIYLCDPTTIIDCNGNIVAQSDSELPASDFRGGSQAIPFDGGWLAVTHVQKIMDEQNRWSDFQYINRFVWFDSDYMLKRMSAEWRFPVDAGIDEFPQRFQIVHGLCWHPDGDHLVMSYELYEREPWVATISANDVRKALLMAPRISLDLEKDAEWVKEQTNRALLSEDDVVHAVLALERSGLPRHIGPPRKDWDSYLAIHHCVATTGRDELIVDAGGERGSSFLRGLRGLDYRNLLNLNINESNPGYSEGIAYCREDITATNVAAESVGFVLCQSVLEHDVDWRTFFRETARILKPGGYAFVSVDYWERKIVASVTIFSSSEISDMIAYAAEYGLSCPDNLRYECKDSWPWDGQDYTFFNFFLRRNI